MTKLTKVLLGLLLIVVIISGIAIIYNQFLILKEHTSQDLDLKFSYIQKQIDKIYNTINLNDDLLNKRITNLPRQLVSQKLLLEYKLQEINVIIINKTLDTQGSGVTLKYKGNYYILTAGHMAKENTDRLTLVENDQEVCDLNIVKHDFMEGDSLFLGHDLMLLKPKNDKFKPRIYTELADFEPDTSNEIYIVGNPVGIEDVVSDGRIIKYKGNFMYYIDHTYFGNSGGGVYNRDSKLIGIVSHLMPVKVFWDIPAYMIYGCVRLDIIKIFLEDVN